MNSQPAQTDGSKPKSTTVMGRRNYCMGDYDPATGEVQFTVCVEKSQGSGTTKEYVGLLAIALPALVC